MASSILYPMSVSAKVLLAEQKVPALGGAPFNRDATLEKGIHVHWALPDALTASHLVPKEAPTGAVFPGVPDLWLVVRFNPGASSKTPFSKRTSRAWVVDSIAETVTPLDSWTPPTDRDASKVHTFAGVLPASGMRGYQGWGMLDPKVAKSFEPAQAAYYPAARSRFGFYDSLDDLPEGVKGKVSYLVAGWFWNEEHDPLTGARRPAHLLGAWKSTATLETRAAADLATQVHLAAERPAPPPWNLEIQVREAAAPSAAKLAAIRRAKQADGTIVNQQQKLETMKGHFPGLESKIAGAGVAGVDLADRAYAQVSAASAYTFAPRHTICHGSIVEVPLAGANTAPVGIEDDNVKLYPNVKRAMADIASKNGSADQVNAIEMLLADLDSQKYSTGGIIDLPGAAHAYTFQSVPGKSQFYARIEIEAKPTSSGYVAKFDLAADEYLTIRGASGHWPDLKQRSASVVETSRIAKQPAYTIKKPIVPKQGPSDQEIIDWHESVVTAFAAAQTAALAKGTPIHERLIRVHDARKNARSLGLGPTTDGTGSDGAGWWIDIDDLPALTQLLAATADALVALPHADNLYEVPGPRWYRSWSPQLVLSGIGGSYKFGFDGRFHPGGLVKTRFAGDTVVSLAVGTQAAVFGGDLLAKPESFNVPGLPGEIVALINETLLLDTESSGAMAAMSPPGSDQAKAQKNYASATQGLLLSAHESFEAAALEAIALGGEKPGPIAISWWKDPFDPVFIDARYAHPNSPITEWKLDHDRVELTPASPAATPDADGQTPVFDERSIVTKTVVNVLKSAMLTRETLDPLGLQWQAQRVDPKLTPETFLKMDIISAPLTKFDSQIFAGGFRLRAGALRMNRIDVVDMFGLARPWSAPAGTATDHSSNYWTPLPPRLPYWSRFQFRLLSSDDPTLDATAVAPPVLGILLPDFLEHALEVFDGEGGAVGQLTTDRPIFGATGAVTLKVKFTVHPWLPQPATPFAAITNPTLRALVESLAAQSFDVPAGNVTWAETGLSAMLRVIDTIRGTLDPTAKTADRKVSLLGEPILVLGARLKIEATSTDKVAELAGDPPPLVEPPDIPSLPVRIGDITRPDDGVLGCFIPGATPADGRFAPVTKEAAQKAIVNALAFGFPFSTANGVEAKHAFVFDNETLFTLTPKAPLDVVILADIRGGIYATCGALPRKKITMPQEYIAAAVRHLEPSFYTGPVLVTQQFDSEKALLPPPEVPGYDTEFLYQKADETAFSSSEVPPAPPLSELPKQRVLLTEGWLRLIRAKK